MAARDNPHGGHDIGHVVEVDANCQHVIVGVWPELDVLVPFYLLATTTPFEVEL